MITSSFNQLAYLLKILAKAIDNNINRVYISFYPYTLLGIVCVWLIAGAGGCRSV